MSKIVKAISDFLSRWYHFSGAGHACFCLLAGVITVVLLASGNIAYQAWQGFFQ